MAGFTGLGGLDVSCALKPYVKPNHGQDPFGGLSRSACRLAFFHWTVKSYRRPDFEASPATFRCPMLWCREGFNDLDSVLQHVTTCSCLDDGHYWCTECSRPERFMDKAASKEASSNPLSRKDSRLKRASIFFKNLSHGGSSQKLKPKSQGQSLFDGSSSKLGRSLSALLERKRRRHSHNMMAGCEDKEVIDPAQIMKNGDLIDTLHKLDNLEAEDLQQLLGHFDEAEAYLRAETSIAGLEVTHSCPPSGPLPPLPVFASPTYDMTDVPCAELDAGEFIPGDPMAGIAESRSVSPFPGGLSRPISPSPVSPLGTILDESQLDEIMDFQIDNTASRPLSSISEAPAMNTTINPSMLMAPVEVPVALSLVIDQDYTSSEVPMRPEEAPKSTMLYDTPDHLSLPAPERGSEFLENSSFQTTEARVQEVRALVDVINQEWVERMTNSPRLLSRCAGLSTSLLFEKGVAAFQTCFRGKLPETFFDLFGLAHVALAMVYTFHRDDEWCRWEEIFNDLLNWQHVLQQESERDFFLDALRHLQQPKSPPQGWLKQLNPSHRSFHQVRSEDFDVPVMKDRPLSELISCDVAIFDSLDQGDNLLYKLRQGRLIQDCATFLDDLEHSGIAGRNKALLPGHFAWYTKQKKVNIAHLLEHIVDPLQLVEGFEALQDIIVDAEFQVKSGLLRTPREVEVALSYGGRFYSRTRPYYERFHAHVVALCDQAMQTFEPRWRDAYYATDLDRMMAIVFEADNQNRELNELSQALKPTDPKAADIPQPKRMMRRNPPPRLAIGNMQKSRRNVAASPQSSKSPSSALTSSSASTLSNAQSPTTSPFRSAATSATQYTPLSTTSFNFNISPVSATCESFTISPTARHSSTSTSFPSGPASLTHSALSTHTNPSNSLPTSRSSAHLSSTTTQNSNTTADSGVTYCPSCPAKFTGNFQYRRSNLRRHLRTTSKHGKVEGPRCPENGCGKVFSRTDNLGLHMVRAHGKGAVVVEEEGGGEVLEVGGRGKRRRWTDV